MNLVQKHTFLTCSTQFDPYCEDKVATPTKARRPGARGLLNAHVRHRSKFILEARRRKMFLRSDGTHKDCQPTLIQFKFLILYILMSDHTTLPEISLPHTQGPIQTAVYCSPLFSVCLSVCLPLWCQSLMTSGFTARIPSTTGNE